MAFFQRLFQGSPSEVSTTSAEDDDIYPVHMLDGTKTLSNIIVTWTLRSNDVEKAGGRLRLKVHLEIYVPRIFTAQRPAVSYSHRSIDTAIEDHLMARGLPRATEVPSFHANPRDFRMFAVREDVPASLQDFLAGDMPMLALHITSFSNTTLVRLLWPHLLMDVIGQQALVRSWSLILAPREAEVPPLLGSREDVMIATPADAVEEEYVFKQHRLKGWSMATFGSRFAWDVLWNRFVETRTIYLPKAATNKKPFISQGDVLTAWGIQALATSLPQPRPITALHALNAHFRLLSLINAPGVYIENMAVAAFDFFDADMARGPLGPIALASRQHLMTQATEPQIHAYLREIRSQAGSGRADPATMLYGDPNAVLMPFTNWTKADFYNTNVIYFSPAVVKKGDGKPGALVYHHVISIRAGASERNILVVLGKDGGVGYWVMGRLLPQTWSRIEESLKGV
ncbi:hypothetical protein EK21DRAFT_103917 [Setomelanomma holmii]|uniref:Uncharacterized protein n=1 Tax=Setomelanomma holmii TaxID=210430 RepID=A0A9P4GZC4_9PLEO|nr:hypothetical protein EK21DRAFT_103917 [Setomelanomma holmii]